MSDFKHTSGPMEVRMASTCFGAWPTVVQRCWDPKAGEVWFRELGECGTSHTEKPSARRSNEMPGDFEENPHRFKKTKDADEALANAQLWATAHRLFDFVKVHADEGNLQARMLIDIATGAQPDAPKEGQA